MNAHSFPESDWKVFRELRALALERFCKRTLDELQSIARDPSSSYHRRYLAMYERMQTRDEELGHAFNNPRRSAMIVQLAAMCAHRLLEPGELERFSERTRATVEGLAKGLWD